MSIIQTEKPVYLDRYVFQHVTSKLQGASPEQICEYFIRHFVFSNEGYLKFLCKEHNLPSDFLKIYERICQLANDENYWQDWQPKERRT